MNYGPEDHNVYYALTEDGMIWCLLVFYFFSPPLESVCLWYHLINHSWHLPFRKYLDRIANYFSLYQLHFCCDKGKTKTKPCSCLLIQNGILCPRLISNSVLHLYSNHGVKYIPKLCIHLHAFGFSRPAGKAFAEQLNSIEIYLSMCLIHLLKWSHGAWS